MDGVPEMSKLKSVPVVLEIDRNEVRKVLEEAIEEKFEQVYLIGFKNKQTDPNGKLSTYNYKCPKCFKFVFKTGHSSGCPTTL